MCGRSTRYPVTMPVPRTLEMLRTLVATPSVSCTQAAIDQGNLAVVHHLASWLADLGFRIDIEQLPDQPEKANLIATLGSGPGGLILAGHTDTVPCDPGAWRSDPFRLAEHDGKLTGLGTSDMKGFFALVIEAVRRMDGASLQAPLTILATADEESSMAGARRLLELGKPKARYAVIGEPTNLKPVYAHKGIMMLAIKIAGASGHSSDPSLGRNALEAMHAVMGELLAYRAELAERWQNHAFAVNVPTLNLGCLHAGDNPNRICGHAELQIDIRILPGMESQEVLGELERRLGAIGERFRTPIESALFYPPIPAFESSGTELLGTCERVTGQRAGTVAFGTEGPFLQALGAETVILGPGSIDQAHQPNEFIDPRQIEPCIGVLRALIERYCLRAAA